MTSEARSKDNTASTLIFLGTCTFGSHEVPWTKSSYQKPLHGETTENSAPGVLALVVPSCLSLSSLRARHERE